MSEIKPEQIKALDDTNALVAARSLIVLLSIKLQAEGDSSMPAGLNVSDSQALIDSADAETRALAESLEHADLAEAAAAARALLLVGMELGYEQEVSSAYESTQAHVLDMGLISGPLLVAGLAAVIAWVPVDTKRRVVEKTTYGPDGSVQTSKEVEEEVKRVGAEALKALSSWWAKVFPGAAG